jgi:hypothetical protein
MPRLISVQTCSGLLRSLLFWPSSWRLWMQWNNGRAAIALACTTLLIILLWQLDPHHLTGMIPPHQCCVECNRKITHAGGLQRHRDRCQKYKNAQDALLLARRQSAVANRSRGRGKRGQRGRNDRFGSSSSALPMDTMIVRTPYALKPSTEIVSVTI